MEEKKLGLPSVISTGVGLIVATSCLMSLGREHLERDLLFQSYLHVLSISALPCVWQS